MQHLRRVLECEKLISEHALAMQEPMSEEQRAEAEETAAILRLRWEASAALVRSQITLGWCRADWPGRVDA